MVRGVVRSILHGRPSELFLLSASAVQVILYISVLYYYFIKTFYVYTSKGGIKILEMLRWANKG